jgi:hypothetical protein
MFDVLPVCVCGSAGGVDFKGFFGRFGAVVTRAQPSIYLGTVSVIHRDVVLYFGKKIIGGLAAAGTRTISADSGSRDGNDACFSEGLKLVPLDTSTPKV